MDEKAESLVGHLSNCLAQTKAFDGHNMAQGVILGQILGNQAIIMESLIYLLRQEDA